MLYRSIEIPGLLAIIFGRVFIVWSKCCMHIASQLEVECMQLNSSSNNNNKISITSADWQTVADKVKGPE